jgi:hypothetical protein
MARRFSTLLVLALSLPAWADDVPKMLPPKLVEGHFGKALDARATPVFFDGDERYRTPPLTVECWVKLFSKKGVNAIVACDPNLVACHRHEQTQQVFATIQLDLPRGGTDEEVTEDRLADVDRIEDPAQTGIREANAHGATDLRFVAAHQLRRGGGLAGTQTLQQIGRNRVVGHAPSTVVERSSGKSFPRLSTIHEGLSSPNGIGEGRPCSLGHCCNAQYGTVRTVPRSFRMSSSWPSRIVVSTG